MGKKVIITVVVLLIVIVGGYYLFSNKPDLGDETIKIGVIYPVTGGASSWGAPAEQGVELAVNEINGEGGINGRKVELIVEDSQCEPAKGVSAINKLINVDKVKYVIGDICSAVVVPTAPIAEENSVVMMAQGSSPDITGIGDYIFRNWPSDSYQGELMAKYVFNELGIKEIAILNVNNPYGNGLADAFQEGFLELGGEVALREKYEQGSKDFKTTLLKIKDKGIKAIYTVSQLEDAVIIRQVEEIGLDDVQIIGADSMATQEIRDATGDAIEGVIYSFPQFDEESEIVMNFQDRFEALFGHKSDLVNVAAHGYDAMNILSVALDGVPYENVDKVKNNIYNIKNYDGVSGSTTFDENGDVIKPYGIYTIKNGESVLLFSE